MILELITDPTTADETSVHQAFESCREALMKALGPHLVNTTTFGLCEFIVMQPTAGNRDADSDDRTQGFCYVRLSEVCLTPKRKVVAARNEMHEYFRRLFLPIIGEGRNVQLCSTIVIDRPHPDTGSCLIEGQPETLMLEGKRFT